jgi:hypothetical protein
MFFRPKLFDALQGYTSERFFKDVGAGLTVGVVALPLAMAFAIASGLSPQSGLFTAIIAGFLISLLGGSRVQIGGPAGAFIVIVYGIVERHGVANLILATAMSGVLLFAMGLLKLGNLVRFIPVAVVIGFTNGIAVLVALSQIKDFLGLNVPNMPADFWGILQTLGHGQRGCAGAAGLAIGGAAHGPRAFGVGARGGQFARLHRGAGAGHRLHRLAGLGRGDHWQPLWRHPRRAAQLGVARVQLGQRPGFDHAHPHLGFARRD